MGRLRSLTALAVILVFGVQPSIAGNFVWNRSNANFYAFAITTDATIDTNYHDDGPGTGHVYAVSTLDNTFPDSSTTYVASEGELTPNTDGQAVAALLGTFQNQINASGYQGVSGNGAGEFSCDYELEQLIGSGGTADGHAQIEITWGADGTGDRISAVGVDIRIQFGTSFLIAYVDDDDCVNIEYWEDDVTLTDSAVSTTSIYSEAGSVILGADFLLGDGGLVSLDGSAIGSAGLAPPNGGSSVVQNFLTVNIQISADVE